MAHAAVRQWCDTPNIPTNIVPTNIARLKLSGKSPMDMRIPPLTINIMLESNPLKSAILVGGLGVVRRLVGCARATHIQTGARMHGQTDVHVRNK